MSNIKIRDSANKNISRYLRASEEHTLGIDTQEVETYLLLLEEQWQRFCKAQEAVELTCGEETIEIEEAIRIQTETWYIRTLINLKKLIPPPSPLPKSPSTPQPVAIQLPKIEFPKFSGASTQWVSFRDIFQSLVHSNAALSSSQKLHYLRSCLEGEALRVISAFEVSDANYKEAWNLLHDRYHVIRIIVDHHLSAINLVKKASDDSTGAIRAVIDPILQHVHSLRALGRPVEFWDDWLVYTTVSKLAYDTRKQWELSLESNDTPSFGILQQFLEIRCRSLEVLTQPNASKKVTTRSLHAHEYEIQANVSRSGSPQHCLNCGGNRRIYVCEIFNALSIPDRISMAIEKKACFNCLSAGHIQNSCRSASSCRICNGRHHTLLHRSDSTDKEQASSDITLQIQASSAHHAATKVPILLSTANIRVQDYMGNWQTARVLFDSGSQTSLVTEACILRLGLVKRSSSIVITGIGNAIGGKSCGMSTLILSPRGKEEKFEINALILPKLTNSIPAVTVVKHDWVHLLGLDLADPEFNKPAPIDILIGMDELQQFMLPEMRKGPPNTPIAQRTTFGWVLAGRAGGLAEEHTTVLTCHTDQQLTRTISKLWDIDQFPHRRYYTLEESLCEEQFASTHRRTEEGQFIVQLPFKKNIPLGKTKDAAERSLLRVEKRFARDANLQREYNEFMKELIQLGHMEPANDDTENVYYMPHHAVIKETSTTTKLRVVFNASMKSSSGYSLNDALMVGPQLQQDLFSLLVRFRAHEFAMTADIEKMYRQVLVDENHVDFQRIIWRNNPTDKFQAFRLLRVTYGVASASYLAVKAIQQIAAEHRSTNSTAANVIQNDFYMDDLLTGTSSEADLLSLQRDLSYVLSQGGFNLRKWASNSKLLLEKMPSESKEIPFFVTDTEEVRTLGLIWNTESDSLSYTVNLDPCPPQLTKRQFLSDAGRFFDPIGLLVPCTVKARLLFQELWIANMNWDDPIPDYITKQWANHRKDMLNIAQLKLCRWAGIDKTISSGELHIFSDASEKAYAASIYARIVKGNEVFITLIAAKAKVAPLKTISLPRLELCGAHLAAKLYSLVAESLQDWKFRKFAWTDSTVTLAWLQAHPSRWSTFIANRVAAVQEVLPPEDWAHIRSEYNPADCASRGMSASSLLQHSLWWEGPQFLKDYKGAWTHTRPQEHVTELELRRREPEVLFSEVDTPWDLLTKFSTYGRLKRVTAYVNRFIINSRKTSHDCKRSGYLSCSELRLAETSLIRYTQRYYFKKEISDCSSNKPISLKSTLCRLSPFLDHHGILRVGGRLKQLESSYDVKHPIILPSKAALPRLIISDIHHYASHAGPQLMHTLLLRRFWITSARNLVRKIYWSCVRCRALNHKPMQQRMADLPAYRLTYIRCFLRSAVDFAGPVPIKFSPGRGCKTTKGYICSFICMGTGAMHLELASDLSTGTFLNAFKRFVNRRGLCQHVYSDNGTNFVGAERELRLMFDEVLKDDKSSAYFADTNVTWHFNPPSAPHMGGYWEIGIKRVKYHLKRISNNNLLTFEEFTTLLTEIEACVNSRPLCTHAADANDLEVLTPGHFIIGEPLKGLPDSDAALYRGNLSERWQLITALRRHFWKRWRDEYVVSLQKRSKWFRSAPNITEGDVVAVIGERTAPTKWKLGRVVRCVVGTDGLVRVALIKTADGELLRPIHKLCMLPTKDDIFSI